MQWSYTLDGLEARKLQKEAWAILLLPVEVVWHTLENGRTCKGCENEVMNECTQQGQKLAPENTFRSLLLTDSSDGKDKRIRVERPQITSVI